MVSIPSPPYFINAFTNSSAPAAFLFTHLFTSPLVKSHYTINRLNHGLPFFTYPPAFASAHALISFSNSASNVSLAVDVPSLRYCSTSTSLFPFELLSILPFCALNIAIPVSASPACWPSILFIPYPYLLYSAKKCFICFMIYVFP